jgi:protein-L-isoaspartate O-methyltransferase
MTLTHMWRRLLRWKRLHPQALSLPRILDIGCGSGYVVALAWAALDYLSTRFKPRLSSSSDIHVVGIECLPTLVQYGKQSLQKWAAKSAPSCRYTILCNNGWKGDLAHGPYLFINVGAQMDKLPWTLLQQLMKGGALLGPVQNDYILFAKSSKATSSSMYVMRYLTAVRFVPLINSSESNTPPSEILTTKYNHTVKTRGGRRRYRTRRQRLKVFSKWVFSILRFG